MIIGFPEWPVLDAPDLILDHFDVRQGFDVAVVHVRVRELQIVGRDLVAGHTLPL